MKNKLRVLFCLLAVLAVALCVLTACDNNSNEQVNVQPAVVFEVDGAEYHTVVTNGNEAITLPSDPVKRDYEFDGWYFDKNVWSRPFTANSFAGEAVSTVVTVYAKWDMQCEHLIVIDKGYDATCSESGLTDGSHCALCKKVFQEQQTIEKKAHVLRTVDAKAPTCTEAGWEEYEYCVNCSYNTKTAIKANGHTESDWIVDVEPDCINKGRHHKECTVCHVTIEQESTDALGHDLKTAEGKAPTCLEAGWEEYEYCSRCDYSDKTEIPANGHHFDTEWSSDGINHWHNSDCGHELIADEAKHTFDEDWTCTVCHYHEDGLHGTELSAKTLDLDGKTLNVSLPNATDRFSFIDEISVAAGASYTVHTEIGCTDASLLKSKTTMLNVGDNELYILVSNGDEIELYTAVIRRRPIYNVTFDVKGGEEVEAQQVEEGGFATLPSTSKLGYALESWNYDFEEAITSDTKITASWTACVYNIVYDFAIDANSASKEVTSENPTTYTIEDEVIFATPVRVGYTFEGWSIEKINKGTTEDVTVTASWKVVEYKINYVLGDGTNDEANITSFTVENKPETVALSDASSESKIFCGWYLNNADGNYITELAVDELKDYTVFALFDGTKGLVFAASADGESWEINGYEGSEAVSLTVPKTYKNKSVTAICENVFSGHSEFTSVSLPDGLVSIANGAFLECSGLSEIAIPASVTSIGTVAFGGCAKLESIEIPVGVSALEDVLFTDCVMLTSVKVLGDVTSMGMGVFTGCENLQTVEFCGNLDRIVDGMFEGCSKLTTVSIAGDFASIGVDAFSGCSELTSIRISKNVTSIGDRAFLNCAKLNNIYFGGTRAEWEQVAKGEEWDNRGETAEVYNVHCSDDVTE